MLRHRFAPRTRDRGLLYYRRGAVRITHSSQGTVLAVVLGTRRYRVELRQTSDALGVSCSCPAFEAGPCKHIWATLLAAEERGLLDRRRDDPAAIGVGGPPSPGSNGPDPRFDRPGAEDLEDLELDPASEADREEDWDAAMRLGPGRLSLTRPSLPPRPARNDWRDRLDAVTRVEAASERAEPLKGQIVYVVDVLSSQATGALALEVARRRQSRKGDWSEPLALRLPGPAIPHLPDPDDREVLAQLHGASADNGYGAYASYGASGSAAYRLHHGLDHLLLPKLCATGRCFLRRDRSAPVSPLGWDDGSPWELWLDMREAGERYVVAGQLRRGGEVVSLEAPVLVLDRIVVFEGVAARFEHARSLPLALELRRRGALEVPRSQALLATERLLHRPERLPLSLPPDLRFAEARHAPTPHLALRAHPESWNDQLVCALGFDYDGVRVEEADPNWCVVRTGERRLVVRDRELEQKEAGKLPALGFRRVGAGARGPGSLQLAPRHLASVVRALLGEGWRVEADGKLHRPARSVRMEVVSGIDWFDLRGAVEFEGTVVPLPAVLAALRRGETAIALGDGTVGMLPEDWLKRYGSMAAFGTTEKDALRFRRSQAGLLDALLASQPDVALDAGFREALSALGEFDGVRPAEQPKGFAGALREYQRQGLGWLLFLERFGFGGCLADDMGLGKTVQVLALLETRRRARKGVEARPSLVVVPRSLMFNWRDEAARFAPRLRILDHANAARARSAEAFAAFDLVLTTYGTLRRDILLLKDVEFDYVVLDEAQTVKNAATDSAKAVRLLKARHRLALSGTPIENHIGELWSLFEFLNPGMLGRAREFARGAGNGLDEARRGVLARALRPFILRRTKAEVARDLPPKVEQTVHCALEAPQRKLYDELVRHYRDSLLARVERQGMGRSKMHVLEALLRLRQAACHPALIDPRRAGEASAKIDVLLPRLAEVREEGHKALVFSQFTSFLSILRHELEARGLLYEYLDGKTRDRAERVRRFQEDPSCGLFLISLKAGGLGLNLTAAEYVFVLDPWWNPAVEAQAIDRTHRIGQGRHVFAYRLIAKDTVEEKVLELQARKKDLAEALLGGDKGLIGDLRREDLEILLS
jgi:superfamily II DNA or RNA helicase